MKSVLYKTALTGIGLVMLSGVTFAAGVGNNRTGANSFNRVTVTANQNRGFNGDRDNGNRDNDNNMNFDRGYDVDRVNVNFNQDPNVWWNNLSNQDRDYFGGVWNYNVNDNQRVLLAEFLNSLTPDQRADIHDLWSDLSSTQRMLLVELLASLSVNQRGDFEGYFGCTGSDISQINFDLGNYFHVNV